MKASALIIMFFALQVSAITVSHESTTQPYCASAVARETREEPISILGRKYYSAFEDLNKPDSYRSAASDLQKRKDRHLKIIKRTDGFEFKLDRASGEFLISKDGEIILFFVIRDRFLKRETLFDSAEDLFEELASSLFFGQPDETPQHFANWALEDHFERHGADFGLDQSYNEPSDYEALARRFFASNATHSLSFYRVEHGKKHLYKFDLLSGQYAVADIEEKRILTYFRRDTRTRKPYGIQWDFEYFLKRLAPRR